MKHQIVLVGGQLLPIYLGIKEYEIEHVIFLTSKDSHRSVFRIQNLFPKVVFETRLIDPFDFEQIKEKTQQVVNDKGNDIQLNLTGGTKVMALAANSVFEKKGLDTVYYDQSGRFYSFASNSYRKAHVNVDIKTFLRLSGHSEFTSKVLESYSSEEIRIACQFYELIKRSDVERLYKEVSFDLGKRGLSDNYQHHFKTGQIEWDGFDLKFDTGKTTQVIRNTKAFEICFTGLWWELVIANEVNKWAWKKEMLMGLELRTNGGRNLAKNEIDIVLNTGKNLVFVECKSGRITQADVSKIRVVKRIYGGVSARSILVCRKKPTDTILEKCQDLDIDVFYTMKENNKGKKNPQVFNNLNDINGMLTNLVGKNEL